MLQNFDELTVKGKGKKKRALRGKSEEREEKSERKEPWKERVSNRKIPIKVEGITDQKPNS
jgi:hypothetical protein